MFRLAALYAILSINASSAMYPDKKDKEIYSLMIDEIIKQNTYGYPMIMTVSNKHDLENPKVFMARGFKVNLSKSDFTYMVYGELSQVRVKRLQPFYIYIILA